MPVVDQQRWPGAGCDRHSARMAFKIVWKSTGEPVLHENVSKQFRFRGTRAECQPKAQVEVPSIGYSWKSDAVEISRADFAVMGEEMNGRYYG